MARFAGLRELLALVLMEGLRVRTTETRSVHITMRFSLWRWSLSEAKETELPTQMTVDRKPYSPRRARGLRSSRRFQATRRVHFRPDALRASRAREAAARRSFGLALARADETYALAARRLDAFDGYLAALHTYFRSAGYLIDDRSPRPV
jgi:hypothetical protein